MPSANAGPLFGLSVLIIEDEFLIAVEAQRIVEEAGACRALLANSVEEARQRMLADAPIDLAVLDIRLGDEDGATLVHELSSRRIPFIIASGFALQGGWAPAESSIVLTKPYRDAELIEAILSALADRGEDPPGSSRAGPGG
jgi:CheY-like chemotaxis protein